MATYKYKAINKDKEVVQGFVEAGSKNDAAGIVEDRGLEVIGLREKKISEMDFNNITLFERITPKDLVIFSRQFSVMVAANVSVVQSLRIVADQTEKAKFKRMINEIGDEVDGGSKLSDTLEKRSDVFDQFYVNVVRSGETSGRLDDVLNYLADEMEKNYDLNSKIRGAMIYPLFIFFVLIVVGILMMILVVPKLTAMFTDSGMDLPLPTRILVGTSGFMNKYWLPGLVIFVAAIAGLRYWAKTKNGKKNFDHLKLRLPVFGELLKKIYLVRFARSMNTLIVGGVTINKGLDIAGGIIGNVVYQNLIDRTSEAIKGGDSISSVFIRSKHVPKMVSQMLSIGEKTGKIDFVLEKIADFYQREIDNTTRNLSALLEPVILVIMGVGVGFMVAAIIMPMYNMVNLV